MALRINISEEWFRDNGVPDPEDAMRILNDWRKKAARNRQPDTEKRIVLMAASGLSRGAIDHYINQRLGKLSPATVRRLDDFWIALGESVPEMRPKTFVRTGTSHRPSHLAILLDICNVPSARFHLECLESVLMAARPRNFTVTLHELDTISDQATQLERVLRSKRPDGVVWFRLTPTRESLRILQRQKPELPAIVLYAARLQYERPVLAHIVPEQGLIKGLVADWANRLKNTAGGGFVVLAHMPEEPETYDFPIEPGQAPSVRNERIKLMSEGIEAANLQVRREEVADYSASRALQVLKRNEGALGYICLSDELAIGVTHLLEHKGQVDARKLVLGFDDSKLAREFGINSFTQHLPEIGERLAKTFADFFNDRSLLTKDGRWPEYQRIPIRVELATRGIIHRE